MGKVAVAEDSKAVFGLADLQIRGFCFHWVIRFHQASSWLCKRGKVIRQIHLLASLHRGQSGSQWEHSVCSFLVSLQVVGNRESLFTSLYQAVVLDRGGQLNGPCFFGAPWRNCGWFGYNSKEHQVVHDPPGLLTETRLEINPLEEDRILKWTQILPLKQWWAKYSPHARFQPTNWLYPARGGVPVN